MAYPAPGPQEESEPNGTGRVIPFPSPETDTDKEEGNGGAPTGLDGQAPEQVPGAHPRSVQWSRVSAAVGSAVVEHTAYAMDSLRCYWEASADYAMDPAVRLQVERDAQRRLDAQRATAEKALRRARTDKARASAQADLNSLEFPHSEVNAKVASARARRFLVRSVLPAGVVFGPLVAALEMDMWWTLAAYPAVWAWSGAHGRALSRAAGGDGAAPDGAAAAGVPVGGGVVLPDMAWVPGRRGIGVDTSTGQTVPVPQGRLLVAGTSGAGKSVAVRVLIADALARGERVVYIDAKGEDAELWRGKGVRVAIDPEEIAAVVAELAQENRERGAANREAGRDHWVPDAARPHLMVLVDEGAEVIGIDSKATPIMAPLVSLGRRGRARGIRMVWCTQNPTVGDGIDRQTKSVLTGARIALRTATETETRTVLGNDATQNGWNAHGLAEYGQCLIRDGRRDAVPVAVWDLSDSAVIRSLPDRPAWERPAPAPAPEVDAGAAERAPGSLPQGSGAPGWSRVELAVLEALNAFKGSASSASIVEHLSGRHGRTPVMEALSSLREQGLVSKGPGHRDPWTRRR